MLKKTLSMLSLLIVSNAKVEPPITGKFFYSEYKSDGLDGLHDLEANIGGENFKLFVTT